MKPIHAFLPALLLAATAATAPAQQLRFAAAAADAVVVARHAGARRFGEHHLLHRLRVETTLRGRVPDTVTVVEVENVSLHLRPAAGETRLYCLHDVAGRARRAGLPARYAPYFRMNGHAGSNPRVGDPARSPHLRLARIVVASEEGRAPRATASALLELVFHGPRSVRTEAVRMLAEHPVLHGSIGPLDLSRLLSRAIGETEDVPFKIALAQLCAERRMDRLVDSLCLAVDAVRDPRFAKALGRIARRLHGEDAADVLRPHIVRHQPKDSRGALLLALGATETEAAVRALLRMRAVGGPDRWVDAALRSTGSPRAQEALAREK